MAGKNFSYFLMDDIPNGRVKCTFANWTGVAYRIPRVALDKCKDRPDLQQSGVYFLFGVDETTDENVVYVGQADVRKNGNGLLGRLIEHKNNSEKDYWTEAVVFTTKDKDNWLGATEISWLESYFCALAKNAKRYAIKNGNEPSPGKPTEEKISDLEEFAKHATVVMGVLNHRVFEPIVSHKADTQASSDGGTEPLMLELVLGNKGTHNRVDVKGYETSDGFVLLKGGTIKVSVAASVRGRIKKLRVELAGKFDEEGVLLEDILLKSPNEAANFATGYSINALTAWKTAEGKTLKELFAEAD
ncbi:GIY-YIG nuclease family protein [Ruminococcaceae bacterium OttesenSCG-928-L11]|nr:GIY-YIG nuclease family protein [Ruminococcaceae bacterium OttesenSCG-928-L11]